MWFILCLCKQWINMVITCTYIFHHILKLALLSILSDLRDENPTQNNSQNERSSHNQLQNSSALRLVKQQNNVNHGPCSFHLFTYLIFPALHRALAPSLQGSDILLQLQRIHTHKAIKPQREAEGSLPLVCLCPCHSLHLTKA